MTHRFRLSAFFVVVATLFLPAIACAQVPVGYAQITGSLVADASGNKEANGTIYFAPVNNSGQAISYRVGSASGQSLSVPVQAPVTNGAFSILVADTAVTSPINVCFSVTVVDNVSGNSILGPGYGCVQPASTGQAVVGLQAWCTAGGTGQGPTCNFDAYPPNLSALAVSVNGPAGTIGVGTVSTLAPGSSASVVNAGTATAAILNFGIPSGATGPTGATGAPGGTANISTSTPGLPCVYTTTTGCGGIDPSVGRYGNGTVTSGLAPLNSVRNIPLMGNQLATTGWSGSIFWGNSIVAGVGTGLSGCSTGSNPATGNCFADLLAIATGTTSSKTNNAVAGDQVCDTVAHAFNSTPPTGNAHVFQVFLNLLNDADVKGRGAYQDVARGCLDAFELFATSSPATRITGASATGTGFTADNTYSGWQGINFTATGQVATFSIPFNQGGRALAPSSLFVLYRTIDMPATGTIPGSVAINVNSSPVSTYISNASPVPVATQNGATVGIMAREIPNTGLSPTNTVTVTSLFQGSQNWSGILGFVTSPNPFQISSYTVASGVPTFTSLNGTPVSGQVLALMDFSTGRYFNGQTVTVTSVNSGAGTFTTTAPSGTPSTVSSTSESLSLAYPSEPGLWVAGSSRNLRVGDSNERDVNAYDQVAQDSVRHLRGVGFQSVLNYVNTQTAWLHNAVDMGPGINQHHPTPQGELEIEAAFLAPTYEPMQVPGSPFFTKPIGRTILTTGPCSLTTADDTVTVYSASPNTCTLPDMMSTVSAANNNQVVRIRLLNAGSGIVTVNASPGEAWADNGIALTSGASITVVSTLQTSTGVQGRYYTETKTGISTPPTCGILPGTTYTIPVGTTCIYANGGASQSYTWPTSGFTVGTEYTIINPVGAVGDITFTNLVTALPVHPGCSAKFMATTTTGIKQENNLCSGNNWVTPTTISSSTYTLTGGEQRIISANTGATTITLPSTWSAGVDIPLVNQGSGGGVWSFTGASSGTATTKVIIPGEQAHLVGSASGRWDILFAVPVYGTTGSIGGASLASGACASGTASISGLPVGSALTQPSPSADPGAGFSYGATVTVAGTVTVRVCNISASAATPAAATYVVGGTP